MNVWASLSLLRLLLRLAVHRSLWPPLVYCPRVSHLRDRRHYPSHQYRFHRRFLCWTCHWWHWRGDGPHPHVQCRDGAKKYSRKTGELLPVFLYHGSYDLVLGKFRKAFIIVVQPIIVYRWI